MTSSQLRNAFKVWLPTECAAFCAAPTEAPSWKAYLLCLEMIFCCGPRTKWGQNFDINIQMVVVSIIPKIFFTKWKGSKLNPNKGGPFLTVPVRATTRGPQPQAIGGAISLKHCVAGVGFERWSFQKGDDGGYLICWNVWKGPDNIHIYNYVYIYIYYILYNYIYILYIYMLIHKSRFSILFLGGNHLLCSRKKWFVDTAYIFIERGSHFLRFGSWSSKIAKPKAGLRVGDTCAVVCEPGFGSLGAVEISRFCWRGSQET